MHEESAYGTLPQHPLRRVLPNGAINAAHAYPESGRNVIVSSAHFLYGLQQDHAVLGQLLSEGGLPPSELENILRGVTPQVDFVSVSFTGDLMEAYRVAAAIYTRVTPEAILHALLNPDNRHSRAYETQAQLILTRLGPERIEALRRRLEPLLPPRKERESVRHQELNGGVSVLPRQVNGKTFRSLFAAVRNLFTGSDT